MRFGRKARAQASIEHARESGPELDDANLPLVDAQGHGFELLRLMDVGHNLWHARDAIELDRLDRRQIVVVTAYTPHDITAAWPLMQRFMTIVLAIGLGPRYGSRALALGAVGYLDGDTSHDQIRSLFDDAVTRVRMRRLRDVAC